MSASPSLQIAQREERSRAMRAPPMFRAPTPAGLPPFSFMVDDIPATPAQIARHLGITTKTLQRYRATDTAPHAVRLALFFETRWGRSAADTEAHNFGQVHYRHAKALQRENAVLQSRIVQLERERATGPGQAANTPFYDARTA